MEATSQDIECSTLRVNVLTQIAGIVTTNAYTKTQTDTNLYTDSSKQFTNANNNRHNKLKVCYLQTNKLDWFIDNKSTNPRLCYR